MYKLNSELQECLRIVDPYLTLDELTVVFRVCMNVMIRLRKDLGLPPKPKGRPKIAYSILDGKSFPEEVDNTIKRITKLRKIEDKLIRNIQNKKKYKKQKKITQIKDKLLKEE